MTKVLSDDRLDAQLERDGFVKVRLFDRHTARTLLRRLDPVAVAGEMPLDAGVQRAELDGALADTMPGHQPFRYDVTVSDPDGGGARGPTRSWSFVDEAAGERSFCALVALEDITGHDGQLRLLRGSHEFDRSPRGTELDTPWLAHVALIEDRMVSVPLEAGECVIFDHGTVVGAFPNHGSRFRTTLAVHLHRTGSPLVHFARATPSTAERHVVEPSFFVDGSVDRLVGDVEYVEAVPGPAGREWLIDAMDSAPLATADRYGRAASRLRSMASSRVSSGAAATSRAARSAVRRADGSGGRIRSRAARLLHDLPTNAAIAVLAVNEAAIDLFGPATPAVWDPAAFGWTSQVEAAYPRIRAEVEALLEGRTEIPHIEDVTGGIPQGNVGPWRSFVLMHQGKWMDWNCERCPETTAVVKAIPGLTMAGFSVLEPGSYITLHRGPNKGALRYQLGVVVPGAEGDCRIRVGDEMVLWRNGEGVVFDFTVEHEAWNDSDEIRVLLMLEFLTPLPWYLAIPNSVAQHAMSWFPTTRDMTRRLKALEPSLAKSAAS